MHRIVFLDRATIAPQIVLPRPGFPHDWVEYDRTAQDQTAARIAAFEGDAGRAVIGIILHGHLETVLPVEAIGLDRGDFPIDRAGGQHGRAQLR